MSRKKLPAMSLMVLLCLGMIVGCASPAQLSAVENLPTPEAEALPPAENGESFQNRLFTPQLQRIGFTAPEYYAEKIQPLIERFHNENPRIEVVFIPWPQNAEEDNYWRAFAETADTSLVFSGAEMKGNYFLDLAPLLENGELVGEDEL